MTRKPWMPLYIADYLADTGHLGAYESGAYLHLIMHQWQCGALPTDERALARIAKVHPPHWPRIREALAPFFGNPKPGGSWVQKRTALELTKAGEISSKRKGAALQKHGKCKAIAVQMHTQSQSQLQTDAPATRTPSVGSPLVSDTAFKLANEIARLCGHNEGFLPPSWLGAPMHVQSWLNQGWTAEQITTSCLRQLANRDGVSPEKISYFDKGIAEFVARPPAQPARTEVRYGRVSAHQQRIIEGRAALERFLSRGRDQAAGRSDAPQHANDGGAGP
jgi:uncharacterized protein YdaU (DUF1376 family)